MYCRFLPKDVGRASKKRPVAGISLHESKAAQWKQSLGEWLPRPSARPRLHPNRTLSSRHPTAAGTYRLYRGGRGADFFRLCYRLSTTAPPGTHVLPSTTSHLLFARAMWRYPWVCGQLTQFCTMHLVTCPALDSFGPITPSAALSAVSPPALASALTAAGRSCTNYFLDPVFDKVVLSY